MEAKMQSGDTRKDFILATLGKYGQVYFHSSRDVEERFKTA